MVSAVLLNARSGFAGTVLSLCAVSLSTYLVVACLQAQAVMSWFVLQAVYLLQGRWGLRGHLCLGLMASTLSLWMRVRAEWPLSQKCRSLLWTGRFLVP